LILLGKQFGNAVEVASVFCSNFRNTVLVEGIFWGADNKIENKKFS